MKINLLLDNPDAALKGYLNIDPFAPENDNSRQKGDITNLDWGIDNGEIEEIIADDVLGYFPFPVLENAVINWINKLMIGGKIVIKGIDLEEVCRQLTFDQIDKSTASRLLYGDQDKKWNMRKSGFSILDVVQFLEGKGMRIMLKLLDGYNYVVQATKI